MKSTLANITLEVNDSAKDDNGSSLVEANLYYKNQRATLNLQGVLFSLENFKEFTRDITMLVENSSGGAKMVSTDGAFSVDAQITDNQGNLSVEIKYKSLDDSEIAQFIDETDFDNLKSFQSALTEIAASYFTKNL